MRKSLLRVALAGGIACVILAPALIWSGQRPQTALDEPGVFKEPPVFTVGPAMTPKELAAREQEKLLSIAQGRWWSEEYAPRAEHRIPPVNDSASLSATEYKGLTPAELQKLAAFQNRPTESIEYKPGPLDPKKEDRVLRFDAPLRLPGEEGLTPSERAKLEASRALDRAAAKDEGGRSR
jgi:hypothetical protein